MKFGHAILGTALAVAGGWIAVGPGLRWLLVNEVQDALQVSARVHGGGSQGKDGLFELRDVEVKRQASDASSVRIDRVVAQVSPHDFLRRRVHVRAAALLGAHFPDQVPMPTALVEAGESPTALHQLDWFPDSLIGGTGDRIYREIESESRLETESLKAESMWLTKLEQLEKERFDIEVQLNALPSLSQNQSNPLRDHRVAKEASDRATLLGDRLLKLQFQREQLNSQYKSERLALLNQRRQELVSKTENRLANSLDSRAIAHSMLIEMSRSVFKRMSEFAKAGAFPLPVGNGESEVATSSSATTVARAVPPQQHPVSTRRGNKLVLTPKAEEHPLFLNKAKWEGDIRIGNRLYRLQGRVANLMAGESIKEPIGSQPPHSICVLQCENEEILVRTNFANTQQTDYPLLEVSTDSLGLNSWKLSNQQGLQIQCQGEAPKVYMQVKREGLNEQTLLTIQQPQIRIEVRSREGGAGERVARQMADSLQKIQDWNCQATLTGDPEQDTNWQIDCNWLQSLESGLQTALKSEIVQQIRAIDTQCAQSIDKIDRMLDNQSLVRDREFDRQVVQLTQRITKYSDQIAPLAQRDSSIRVGQQPSSTDRR